MKGLLMMLKSMGIEIDPAEIEKLRVGIPRLIIDVQASVKNFDERLTAIEKRLSRIDTRLNVLMEESGEKLEERNAARSHTRTN